MLINHLPHIAVPQTAQLSLPNTLATPLQSCLQQAAPTLPPASSTQAVQHNSKASTNPQQPCQHEEPYRRSCASGLTAKEPSSKSEHIQGSLRLQVFTGRVGLSTISWGVAWGLVRRASSAASATSCKATNKQDQEGMGEALRRRVEGRALGQKRRLILQTAEAPRALWRNGTRDAGGARRILQPTAREAHTLFRPGWA